MDHGQRGQHDRIADHLADVRPGVQGPLQFVRMLAPRPPVAGIHRLAPAGQERAHRVVGQRVDPGVGKRGQHRAFGVRRRAAGHHEPAAVVVRGGAFDQPRERLPPDAVGRFVQAVQQDRAGTVGQLPLEEIAVQVPAEILAADLGQVEGQPGGRIVLGRGAGRVPPAFDAPLELGQLDQDWEAAVAEGGKEGIGRGLGLQDVFARRILVGWDESSSPTASAARPEIGGPRTSTHPTSTSGPVDALAGASGFAERSWHRAKTTRRRKVVLPEPGSPTMTSREWDSACCSSTWRPASPPAQPDSSSGPRREPAAADSGTSVVVKVMYSWSIGNRCALPVPTCRPRMAMWPLSFFRWSR